MEQDEMNADTAATPHETAPEPPPPPGPPAPPAQDAGSGLVGQVAAGLALIVLGGALLVLERLDSSPDHLFLILVGGVFVAGYFYRRAYGFLIPGGLLIGLGSGLALEDLYAGPFADAESGALGLGLGFFLVYIVSLLYERRNRWWALIPGGVLVLAGFPDWAWTDELFDYWPLGIMAVGAFLLFRSVMGRRRDEESSRWRAD